MDDLSKKLHSLVAELEEGKDASDAGVIVPPPPMTGKYAACKYAARNSPGAPPLRLNPLLAEAVALRTFQMI